MFINNIQNTVVNYFVTNLNTGAVWNFPNIPYGTPYAFPPNWCGGAGGGFAWSANIGVPFFNASFAGGGYFNANAGCGILPYVPPPAPLIIAAPSYPQYYANNYYQPPNCGCVYVNNTYLYGQQQGNVFVPRSWTPDIVTQPARPGVPPFIYGTGRSPSYWWLLWLGLSVTLVAGIAGGGAWWWERRNGDLNSGDPHVPALT